MFDQLLTVDDFVKHICKAAFVTLDRGILLSRFENVFGISGAALKWIASYLTDRSQVVVIDSEHSKPEIRYTTGLGTRPEEIHHVR